MNSKPRRISANESNSVKLRADSCLACLLFQDALVASRTPQLELESDSSHMRRSSEGILVAWARIEFRILSCSISEDCESMGRRW